MSDLIKREDAIKAIEELPNAYNGWSDAYDKAYIIGTLEEVPKADRPQGEWKSVKASIYPYGYDVECSVCGFRMGSSFGYKYCPNCGAYMKGADDE